MVAAKKYYLLLPAGIPTQGDIWSNLPFPTFDIVFRVGILITPRCDFAHDKAKVFNYIPGMFLDDYMSHFGFSRILGEELNRQKNILKGLGVQHSSFSLLEIGVSEDEVMNCMQEDLPFQQGLNNKDKKTLQKFKDTVSCIHQIRALMSDSVIEKEKAFHLIKEKDVEKHREMVMRNQISDLHFLPPCPPLIDKPLVFLLRYICTCQMELLVAADKCVNEDDWRARCAKSDKQMTIFSLCPVKPDRILRLKSPFLENLISRIASLYMRVGVPDLPKSEFRSFSEEGLS